MTSQATHQLQIINRDAQSLPNRRVRFTDTKVGPIGPMPIKWHLSFSHPCSLSLSLVCCSTRVRVKLECHARAECTYALQLGAIATTRHALKLRASHCSGAGGREGGREGGRDGGREGKSEEEEDGGEESEPRRLYAKRGRVLGRVARNSFSLVRHPPSSPRPPPSSLLPPPSSLVLPTASPLAHSARPTAVRALTCHWPCPLASVPRLPTRPFIRDSFSPSFSSPSSPPLPSSPPPLSASTSSPSAAPGASDSRVYSHALAATPRRPGTRVLASSREARYARDRGVTKIQPRLGMLCIIGGETLPPSPGDC